MVLAEERPQECTAWREKVLTVLDEDASNRLDALVLKKAHAPAEVAQLVAAYPVLSDPPTRSLERDSSGDEVKKAIDEFSRRPPCEILTLFSLVKSVWTAKDFSAAEKKRVLSALLNLLVRADSPPRLADIKVQIFLIEGALEAGVLKVSDPLYLKLGALRAEAFKLAAAVRAKQWDEKQVACFEKGICDLKTAWSIYREFQWGETETNILSHEWVWWVKRARAKN